MARVLYQNIPAGLQALWDRVANSKGTRYSGVLSVNLAASVLSGPPDPFQTLPAQAASDFAAWLRDRHAAGLDAAGQSQFYTDRRAELLAGVVNPAYWHAASVLSDSVSWGAPVVKPYTDNWDALYYDPLRMPSRCTYGPPSLSYPFSEAGTTTAKPLPGWTGAVSGNVFQDLWLAQRRVIFTLPSTIGKADGWPVLLVCEATIQASATVRGNRNWFVVNLEPYFSPSTFFSGSTFTELYPRWPRELRYEPGIPGDSPGGWDHTVTRRVVQDGRFNATWLGGSGVAYCGLRIVIPPSLGVYFSRNDTASVVHTLNPALYLAKP